jgi:hypothetical protein
MRCTTSNNRLLLAFASLFLISMSSLFMASPSVSAQPVEKFSAAPEENACPIITGRIVWPTEVKTNTPVEYSFAIEESTLIPWLSAISVGLSGESLKPWNRLAENFTNPGAYILVSQFSVDDCPYEVTQEIYVYDRIYTYVGKHLQQYRLEYDSIYHDNGILLKVLPLDDEWLLNKQAISNIFLENIYYLRHSEVLIIHASNFLDVFDVLRSFVSDIRFEQKSIYIISATNQNLATRLISYALQWLQNPNTYFIKENYAPFFLSEANDLERVNIQSYVSEFSVELTAIKPLQFGSYLFNFLIYNGIPVSVLSLIMSIWLSLVLLIFLKQVVGMNTYGMINPILFALSVHILWPSLSVLLFGLWLMSSIVTQLILKNIHLHFQAKLGIYASLYLMLFLISLWLDAVLGWNYVSLSVFQNPLTVITVLFFILKMRNFFYDDTSLFSKRLWKEIIEFLLIALILLNLIEWRWLQYQLLIYPELLLVFFVLSVMLWRYTWLQLTEIIRFRWLLFRRKSRSSGEEDDEE